MRSFAADKEEDLGRLCQAEVRSQPTCKKANFLDVTQATGNDANSSCIKPKRLIFPKLLKVPVEKKSEKVQDMITYKFVR